MATFKGVDVTAGLVPVEIVAALPGNLTQDQFTVRLQDGGTMELQDSNWVIGDANFAKHSVIFAALDTLNLKGTSGIVTNGNTLVLFVNKLNSEDANIIGFRSADINAPSGAAGVNAGDGGAPGFPGIGGGIVSITVVQALNGILNFNLSGQNGGNGGNGVAGIKGSTGPDGTPCQAGGFPVPHCLHDGGQGSTGGTGSPGGHGGDGGTAGQGGSVFLFNVGDAPLPTASYSFAAAVRAPGKGGDGGAGGPGGDGGQGGDGNVFCHHGYPGGPGDQGRNGDHGNQGAQNAPGKILAQNLNLTAIVARANGGQV